MKSGRPGPTLTLILTGLVAGQEEYAAGVVLITSPTGTVPETVLTTTPGFRCDWVSACSAAASGWPVTSGTRIICGPSESTRVTAPPPAILEPLAGTVVMTSPFGSGEWTGLPTRAISPALCSTLLATLAAIPCIDGTLVYRPALNHQLAQPTATTTTTATRMSQNRRPNSSRSSSGSDRRLGSRWPRYIRS